MLRINRLVIHFNHLIKHRCHFQSILIPYQQHRHFHLYNMYSVIFYVIVHMIHKILMKHHVENKQLMIVSVRIPMLVDIYHRSIVNRHFLVIVFDHTYDLSHQSHQHLLLKITIYLKQPIQHGLKVDGQRLVYDSLLSQQERMR
jgi:hypothetical protein